MITFNSNGSEWKKNCRLFMLSRLHNSVVFIFMKEYLWVRNLMSVFSSMKSLNTSSLWNHFLLERNSMNVTNVVKPLCYGTHWIPTQFKHKDNSNDKDFWSQLDTHYQDHKNIFRSLAIDLFFCIFLVSWVSNKFPECV